MKKSINLIILVMLGISTYSQFSEHKYSTKEIRVREDNKVIIASILIGKHKEVPKKLEQEYLWYLNNEIKTTKGDYYGKLLHGEYRIFDKNNNIISSGMVQKGLREGQWIEWHDNGNYKNIGHWHKGQPHGKWTNFGYDGMILSKVVYKHGVEKKRIDVKALEAEAETKEKQKKEQKLKQESVIHDSTKIDTAVEHKARRPWFGFLKRKSSDSSNTETMSSKDLGKPKEQKDAPEKENKPSKRKKESDESSNRSQDSTDNTSTTKRRKGRPPAEETKKDESPNE